MLDDFFQFNRSNIISWILFRWFKGSPWILTRRPRSAGDCIGRYEEDNHLLVGNDIVEYQQGQSELSEFSEFLSHTFQPNCDAMTAEVKWDHRLRLTYFWEGVA